MLTITLFYVQNKYITWNIKIEKKYLKIKNKTIKIKNINKQKIYTVFPRINAAATILFTEHNLRLQFEGGH